MRLAFVPKTTEFYDLFTRAGENMLEIGASRRAALRRVPRGHRPPERGQGTRVEGRRPHARDPRAPEHPVRDAVRPRGHLRAREGDRRRRRLHGQRVRPPRPVQGRVPARRVARAVQGAGRDLGASEPRARRPEAAESAPSSTSSRSRSSKTRATGSCAPRIAGLFDNDADALNVIRWKDILEALEDAIDSCETAAISSATSSSRTSEMEDATLVVVVVTALFFDFNERV